VNAARQISENAKQIASTVQKEMDEYARLRSCWPIILKEMKTIKIWNKDDNLFKPKESNKET
jgi:hypothetical protein